MIKFLISKFMPSNEKLAAQASSAIRKGVNNATDGKEAVVAKYATLSAELSQIAKNLSDIMADAKIDETEESTLTALLVPLFAKAREVVGV